MKIDGDESESEKSTRAWNNIERQRQRKQEGRNKREKEQERERETDVMNGKG